MGSQASLPRRSRCSSGTAELHGGLSVAGFPLPRHKEHSLSAREPGWGPNHGTNEHGVLSAISNEMVRIYKDQFGRGPTKTRTQWAGPDILVVTLEQTFTPAERRLRELDEHERLRELRLLFQYAAVSVFCDPVEQLTGRK